MGDRKFHGNQYTLNEELEYDYEDMVKDIEALASELGHAPTTREAERDDRLPSIKKIYRILSEREWNDLLADAGVGETQVGEYGPDERPKILADMRRVFGSSKANHLTIREYSEHGKYNKSVVKRLFGTWNNACKAAEIPHGLKHGRPCKGPNGEHLASRLEYYVATALDEWDFEYVPHKPIPDTRWRCDFFIPELSLWIEADGYLPGQRPNPPHLRRNYAITSGMT